MTLDAIVALDLQRSSQAPATLRVLNKVDSRQVHVDSSLTRHMMFDTPLLPGLIGDCLMNESRLFPTPLVVLPVVASNVIVPRPPEPEIRLRIGAVQFQFTQGLQ